MSAHEMMERVTQQMGMLAFGASLPNYMGPDSLQHSVAGGAHSMPQIAASSSNASSVGPANRRGLAMGGGMSNAPMGGAGCMGGQAALHQGVREHNFSMPGVGMPDGGMGGGIHAALQARARRPRGSPLAGNHKDLGQLPYGGDGGDGDLGAMDGGGFKGLGRGGGGGGRGRSRKR